ncbi:hypothetical protein AQUCO_01400866v1 [Aquilegia coerulea]|uniref:Knottin scorpion toxin-like domain-containing protein n=1 Tax=Aquilegia coerulea TaxID=218851 RepID=A0A2G5DYI1_AQUCA|nr:hypothetical protein AQUCO_01400866v1 [Aquilegia coerulea]
MMPKFSRALCFFLVLLFFVLGDRMASKVNADTPIRGTSCATVRDCVKGDYCGSNDNPACRKGVCWCIPKV